jgi:hypothetical protein
MGKVKQTVDHVFVASSEQELDAQLAEFKRQHEAETGQRLAIDGKRPLGPGKVRMTFRVVAVASKKR